MPLPNAATEEANAAHLALISQLDIYAAPKPFRSPTWRPNQRRNKNIKAIISDTTRKEASLTTQDNSGAATPALIPDSSAATSESGDATPAAPAPDAMDVDSSSNTAVAASSETQAQTQTPNLAQASTSLSKLVLEKNMKNNSSGGGFMNAPGATYTNIESAPSLAHQKRYCDITGLSAPYTDPKTRLRYHNKEIFGVVRSLGQREAEEYLEARGAHTVLK